MPNTGTILHPLLNTKLCSLICFLGLGTLWATSQAPQTTEGSGRAIFGKVLLDQPLYGNTNLPEGIFVIAIGVKPSNVLIVKTDAKGEFDFRQMEDDHYQLWVEHPVFGQRAYKSKDVGTVQDVVIVDKATTRPSIEIRVRKGATLKGHVWDADRKPVAGASLYLLQRSFRAGGWLPIVFSGTTSAKDGGYAFEPVDAEGPMYLVAVTRTSNSTSASILGTRSPGASTLHRNYQLSFYPNSDRFSDATPVLTRGQLFDVDADLSFSPHEAIESEIIVDTSAIGGIVGMEAVVVKPGVGTAAKYLKHLGSVTPTDQAERFRIAFTGLSKGEYLLILESKGGAKTGNVLLRELVSFKKGDLPRLITLQPPSSLTGRLVLQSEKEKQEEATQQPELSSVKLFLEPEHLDGGPLLSIVSTQDGYLEAPALPPGRYYLRLSGAPKGMRVKGIMLNGEPHKSSELLEFFQLSQLSVTISQFSSTISGIVKDVVKESIKRKSGPLTVVAIPHSGDYDDFLSAQTDTEGRFSFAAVRPGRYRILAVEHIERNAHKDPSFVRSASGVAVEVEVKLGSSVEGVEARIFKLAHGQ